jgi:hypothetical protein
MKKASTPVEAFLLLPDLRWYLNFQPPPGLSASWRRRREVIPTANFCSGSHQVIAFVITLPQLGAVGVKLQNPNTKYQTSSKYQAPNNKQIPNSNPPFLQSFNPSINQSSNPPIPQTAPCSVNE